MTESKPDVCTDCQVHEYLALATEDHPAGALVTLIAVGTCPSAGYEVFLEELPITVYPPEFALRCTAPTGPVIQPITFFTASISFELGELVRSINVHDAKGVHPVPVRPVPPDEG